MIKSELKQIVKHFLFNMVFLLTCVAYGESYSDLLGGNTLGILWNQSLISSLTGEYGFAEPLFGHLTIVSFCERMRPLSRIDISRIDIGRLNSGNFRIFELGINGTRA